MRWALCILLAACSSETYIRGDGPPVGTVEGSFTIQTPDDMALLRRVARVEGSLTVATDGITDLSGLAALEVVQGDLVVDGCGDLETFDGLDALTEVGGDLRVVRTPLRFLDGPPALTAVGGDLRLEDLPELDVLDGAPLLDELGGDLVVSDAPQLVAVEGFGDLPWVRGSLVIERLPGLVRIGAFDALDEVSLDVRLSSAPGLTDLEGFTGLVRVGGVLEIEDLGVADLDQLGNVTALGGLRIAGNAGLLSLRAFVRVTSSLTGGLTVQSNPRLERLLGLDSLSSIQDRLEIVDNDVLSTLDNLVGITLPATLTARIARNPALCATEVTDLLDGTGASCVECTLNAGGC